MQITKYWITEFSNPLDAYKKFYTALKMKGVPLIKEDYANGFFEVDSRHSPTVISTSTITKIPIQLVSTRTVTTTKPTPKPVVTPTIQPANPDYPPPPTDKPGKDDGSGKVVLAVIAFGLIYAFSKKKKGRK